MRRILPQLKGRTVAAALGAAFVVTLVGAGETQASSHREAPFISKNPKVDGTDFYMFQSYSADRISASDGTSAYTTLIANYIPLQDSYGGPNYFSFDPAALYEIHIENSGDAVEDLTFQFQFTNALNSATANGIELNVGGKMNSVPTIQGNITVHDAPTPITAGNESSLLNVQESFTINMVKGPRRTGMVSQVKNHDTQATKFVKPVDYIGSATLGSAAAYHTYAQAHIYNIDIPGCTAGQGKVFVGQRAEGFRVNLGLIFDLVNVTSLGGLNTITTLSARNALNFNGSGLYSASNTAYDVTATKNVSSIALEIPTACLTSDGMPPSTTARPSIGGWTTASVRQARVINPKATYGLPAKEGGAWAQVSRLGMPLTNEVVIGIADKDKFNSSNPADDAQFADYVTNPTMPQILQAIFGGASTPVFPADTVVRSDLVAIFLTGITGVNATGSTAEMLRLNTKLGTKPTGGQTDLGAALCFPYTTTCQNAASIAACFTPTLNATGCDTGGFPNGRRPGDDVVDIELTALLGYFVPQAQATHGGTVLHDAVLNTESQFDPLFPYLKDPHSGDQ